MKTLLPAPGPASTSQGDGQPEKPAQPAGGTSPADKPAADKPEPKAGDPGSGKPPTETSKPPEGGAEPGKEEQPKPVTYEFKVPDSKLLAADHVEKLRTLATELKLEPAAAQRLLDRDATTLQDFVAGKQAAYDAEVDGWYDAVDQDKELGGARLPTTQANVKRFLETVKDEEFTKLLFTRGYINHPAVVRVLNKVGALMSTPTGLVNGGTPPVERKETAGEVLYGAPAAK